MRNRNIKQKMIMRAGILLVMLLFPLLPVVGQESINTSGQNVSGNGGTVSYSIGQIVYETYTATDGMISEGVQQPTELAISALEKIKKDNHWVTTYPNPTNESFTLEIKNVELSDFQFQLYDTKGDILQNKKIKNRQTKVIMSNLLPAIYLLRVIQKEKEVITFKIIKK